MNANELADELERFESFNGDVFFGTCAAMLRQQQAEIEALKAKYEDDYAKAFEKGYAIGLLHGKDLVNNG